MNVSACKQASATLAIPRGNVVMLENRQGALVRVVNGVVWITEDGSLNDVCLNAGEQFRLTRNGLAAVNAIGKVAATVEVVSAAAQPFFFARSTSWFQVVLQFALRRYNQWTSASRVSRVPPVLG